MATSVFRVNRVECVGHGGLGESLLAGRFGLLSATQRPQAAFAKIRNAASLAYTAG